LFHADSYGYRPRRSAHQALAVARQRCWGYDWVLDLDIKAFFDSIDHALLMRVVRYHTDCPWVLLYVERWLKAPVVMPDGAIENRTRGTAQGSVISPLLANLFLHYVFDRWMRVHYPKIPFERYADDVICHCRSEKQAHMLQAEIATRLAACKLELHPQKTKIVYCMDSNRRMRYPNRTFDFLGYTFRPRQSMNRQGRLFVSFAPAVSDKAAKAMRERIRRWEIHHHNDLELKDIASWTRPIIEGWVRYYGRFYGSALRKALHTLDVFIVRWALRKYKRFRGRTMRLWDWYRAIRAREPHLFPHWSLGATAGR
jgi:RNA-directed DNA polymerase